MIRQKTFATLAVAVALSGLSLGCKRDKPDALVNAAVLARLEREPSLATSEVNAVTSDGHVVLTGSVSTDEQRRLAAEVADDVSGVKDVTNQIAVASTTPPVGAPPTEMPPQEVPEQPVGEQPEQPGTPPEGYPLTPSPVQR